MKKALITGITGQDGSYLAELLLDKGYEVWGSLRRSSSFNTGRIDHIFSKLKLVYADLTDANSIENLIIKSKPDEIYALGAQSHVKTSFDIPEYTANATAIGTLHLLTSMRMHCPEARYYQASSSEMFGSTPAPQNELTTFHPRSPYGIAKVYAHGMTVNFREGYGLHASCGILFNHECVAENTPIMIRQKGIVNVVVPSDLIAMRNKGANTQTFEIKDTEIWDGKDWTKIKVITATKRKKKDEQHRILSIETRAGVIEVTAHHKMLDSKMQEIEANKIQKRDNLALLKNFPNMPSHCSLTKDFAEFLGLMASDGYISDKKKAQFTNNDESLISRVADLWSKLFLGSSRYWVGSSGFNKNESVGQLALIAVNTVLPWLREQLYTSTGYKKVPVMILNADKDIQTAFLNGYYAGDGLQAGNGDSIKTNSAVLAQGICWLYANQGRKSSVYVEHRNEFRYYQLNIYTNNPKGDKGKHLRKEPSEVRNIKDVEFPSEWVYDLETESGVFCAGVGGLIIHNSPRRGDTFVTKKIVNGAVNIYQGLAGVLKLGNLDAQRDWGYAPEYVEGMWRMLQQDKPDDYVLATGETHTVREFCQEAFAYLGMDYQNYIEIDAKYYRPAEVDVLQGDASKAKRVLGWEPKVKFKELVRIMIDAEMRDEEPVR